MSGRPADASVQTGSRQSLMSGLYITSQTVEWHSGTINITAEPDTGVAYVVWLPLTPSKTVE